MSVETKIRIERAKIALKHLSLVILGVIIGVSWLVAYQNYLQLSF